MVAVFNPGLVVLTPTTPIASRRSPPAIPTGESAKSSSMMDVVHPQKKNGTPIDNSATGRNQTTEQTGEEPEHARYAATPTHSADPKSLLASLACSACNSANARITEAVHALAR